MKQLYLKSRENIKKLGINLKALLTSSSGQKNYKNPILIIKLP